MRQAEYKYTYSDRSNATLKSEQADMLVQAVEKFAQKINLNLEEIFVWYFEQKGVDNPERFLGVNKGVKYNTITRNIILNEVYYESNSNHKSC